MDSDGFFGWVWRFNALVIACAALLGVLAMGSLILQSFRYVDHPDTTLVDKAQEPSAVHFALDALPDTESNVAMYGLSKVQSSRGAGYNSGSGNSSYVNLLAVERFNATGKWVFEGTERIIWSREPLTVSTGEGATKVVRAIGIVLTVTDTDTDKDGRLTARDERKIICVSLPSLATTEVLSGLSSVQGIEQWGDGMFLVVYEKGGAASASTYGPDFTLRAQNELPRVTGVGDLRATD